MHFVISIYQRLRTFCLALLSKAGSREGQLPLAHFIPLLLLLETAATLGYRISFDFFGPATPFMFYLPAVILAAAYGGGRVGSIATLLSAALAAWVWTPSLSVSPLNWFPLTIFLAVALLMVLVICALQHLARLHRNTARDLEHSQQALKKHTAHLEKIVEERTAILRTFAYAASHDLRSPLRAMHGYAATIRQDYGHSLDQVGHEHLARICKAAEVMDTLVLDVVNYTGVAAADLILEPVNLHSVFARVMAQPLVKRTGIQFKFADALLPVSASSSLVFHAFYNLFVHAANFVVPQQADHGVIWTEPRSDRVRIHVEHRGMSIPSEVLPKIFEAFRLGYPTLGHVGTGLGFNIVAKAVEKMGGSVGVESIPGKGATFWLELPAANS